MLTAPDLADYEWQMCRAQKDSFCVTRENSIAVCCMLIPVQQGCADSDCRSCQKAMQTLKAQLQEDNAFIAAVLDWRGFQRKGVDRRDYDDPSEMGWKGDVWWDVEGEWPGAKDECQVCPNLSHPDPDSYWGDRASSTGRQGWHRGTGYFEDLASVLTL